MVQDQLGGRPHLDQVLQVHREPITAAAEQCVPPFRLLGTHRRQGHVPAVVDHRDPGLNRAQEAARFVRSQPTARPDQPRRGDVGTLSGETVRPPAQQPPEPLDVRVGHRSFRGLRHQRRQPSLVDLSHDHHARAGHRRKRGGIGCVLRCRAWPEGAGSRARPRPSRPRIALIHPDQLSAMSVAHREVCPILAKSGPYQ